MSNRGFFASAAVFVFYVGPGFTLQIDSTVVSILTNTVFVNSTNITTNIETAELSSQLQLNLAGAAATDHRWPFPCDRFPLWPQAARLTLDSRIRQTDRKPRLAARHERCQDAVSILPIVLEMQSNSFTSTICILKMQNPFSSAEMQSEFSHQY